MTHVVIDKVLLRVDVVAQTDETRSELKVIQSAIVVLIKVIECTLHFFDLLLVDSLTVSDKDLILYRILLSCHS